MSVSKCRGIRRRAIIKLEYYSVLGQNEKETRKRDEADLRQHLGGFHDHIWGVDVKSVSIRKVKEKEHVEA